MTATHFELPANLTAAKLISALDEKMDTQLVSRQYLLKTYYDSFDWRLYREGVICEFNRSKQSSSLLLTNRTNGELIASTLLFDVPTFCKEFNPGKVRQTLEPLLGVRALLAVCTLECEVHHLDIVNKDEKIVLRIMIEEFDLLNNRLSIFPVKGYDKVVNRITDIITEELRLTVANKPLLLDALRLQGRHPKDYSSKLDIRLNPDIRADIAWKAIFSYLLRTIKLNEQGTIADTDSEFLHDFRVAIRRTRVGLSQAKNVLPEEDLSRYKEFFSWLGQMTGETRDLDVYLMNFDEYKKKMPALVRQSINPLYNFLSAKKTKSHQQLAKKLRSSKYIATLKDWEKYLFLPPLDKPSETIANLTIKELADKKIWKTYKVVLKEGTAINRDSPPETLHKLRKTCKKLRYLMEFFQNLYPEKSMDKLIKRLKQFQDVLGEFQDYSVQQERLQKFSEEMQTINTPSKTFLAMGVLIKDFENRKCKARDAFTAQFAGFKKSEIHESFRELFAPKKP